MMILSNVMTSCTIRLDIYIQAEVRLVMRSYISSSSSERLADILHARDEVFIFYHSRPMNWVKSGMVSIPRNSIHLIAKTRQ